MFLNITKPVQNTVLSLDIQLLIIDYLLFNSFYRLILSDFSHDTEMISRYIDTKFTSVVFLSY